MEVFQLEHYSGRRVNIQNSATLGTLKIIFDEKVVRKWTVDGDFNVLYRSPSLAVGTSSLEIFIAKTSGINIQSKKRLFESHTPKKNFFFALRCHAIHS